MRAMSSQGPYKREVGESKVEEKGGDNESRDQRDAVLGRGHEPGRWAVSTLGKEKEADSPLEPSEGMQPCHTFLLV